ncbi:MAG: nicotinate (nicotinamide) nucleotide adenylyltransferase [Ignavibacteria bacterium]|nr:nicotinate (nicotinamide) nucleotide adenylyltransferase [Ignavibacteria bacterium]
MNIGIIGGSFNPVHIAHLIIADRFVDQMKLDRCYFVPTNLSPFKTEQSKHDATPAERFEMVQHATILHPQFRVSDTEIVRGGVSYTVDTIKQFKEEHPDATLHLLIGSDQAIEFVRWKDWKTIVELAQLCIVRRPFMLTPEQERRLTESLTVNGKAPIWINAPLLEISSTEIRKRVSENRGVNYLTVKAVRDYITEHQLYK